MNPEEDIDQTETGEWLDALRALRGHRGKSRSS